jgi:hypothetical protein
MESLRSDLFKVKDGKADSILIFIFLDKIDGIPSFDIRFFRVLSLGKECIHDKQHTKKQRNQSGLGAV